MENKEEFSNVQEDILERSSAKIRNLMRKKRERIQNRLKMENAQKIEDLTETQTELNEKIKKKKMELLKTQEEIQMMEDEIKTLEEEKNNIKDIEKNQLDVIKKEILDEENKSLLAIKEKLELKKIMEEINYEKKDS